MKEIVKDVKKLRVLFIKLKKQTDKTTIEIYTITNSFSTLDKISVSPSTIRTELYEKIEVNMFTKC